MKILSSDEVIEAAEKAGRLIVDTYLSPNREFADLPELMSGMDPFREFSDACRGELQAAPGAEALSPCRCYSISGGWEGTARPASWGRTQRIEGDEGVHCPQSVSQAARKTLTRSRTKLGTSFRSCFSSPPITARITIGCAVCSLKSCTMPSLSS